jgi:hypothetical protein
MARRNGVRDYTEIPERGGNPNELVSRIYDDGRAVGFPRNKPPRPRHDPAENDYAARQGRVDPAKRADVFNECTPQHPENFHDKAYDNLASGWVRGVRSGQPNCDNEDATCKPFFDKGNAWRTDRKTGMRDQIKDYSADHNRHHTEFEHKHNAGVTHTTEAHDFSKRHVPSYERRGELGLNRHSEPKSRR